jgi:hypothetical protein
MFQSKGSKFYPFFKKTILFINEMHEKKRTFGQLFQAKCIKKKKDFNEEGTKWLS